MNISQVTTEQDLVNRSYELEGALASGSFIQYCNAKVESSTQELERTLWSFLKVICCVYFTVQRHLLTIQYIRIISVRVTRAELMIIFNQLDKKQI